MADPAKKDRFVNRSGGWLGALVRAPGTLSGFKGISLYPGQEIDLDEEEQAMTANAPRDPRANALANGNLALIAEGMDFKGRRPLRPDPNLAIADPNNPATWSEEQRSHVESERTRMEAERAKQLAEAGGEQVEPARQPAVGEYALFEEQATPTEQPPVVGGATIQGDVAVPSEGEPALTKPADDLLDLAGPPELTPPLQGQVEQPVPDGVIPQEAVSVVLGPADRVGHVPGAAPRPQPGSLPGIDRGTATP